MQLVGYICLSPAGPKKTTLMTPTAVGGLGAFAGLVALPAILFRAVAVLDFTTVDTTVVLALFVGKLLLIIASCTLGMLTSDERVPGHGMVSAGAFALLTTNSDDLGLGLPVLGAIFPPKLVSMCFVLNALQSMIFNPLVFCMLGVGAARRDAPTDGTPPASDIEILRSVIKGLSKNHTVLAVLLGLTWNVCASGGTLRGAPLPFFLENLTTLLGQAFGPIVLFMAGTATVGSFSQLGELDSAIMPIATVLLKSFLLPTVVLCVVSLLGGSKVCPLAKSPHISPQSRPISSHLSVHLHPLVARLRPSGHTSLSQPRIVLRPPLPRRTSSTLPSPSHRSPRPLPRSSSPRRTSPIARRARY